MDIIQCKFCNKPFQSIGNKVCHACMDRIDSDFITIRDYMYDNPGAVDIDVICEATKVQRNVVLFLIKEKRVTIVAPGMSDLRSCSVCGKPTSQDSMCEICRRKLSDILETQIKPAPSKEEKSEAVKSQKMHTR
ncbi:MAG: hypothetical protein FWG32_05715 [Oscillospiraceae bacterium]|nr:hypothetical protein [Oscillospiraceae bacterium]